MSREDDLNLVLDTADAWAGEYGFVAPDKATKVMEVVERLRPPVQPLRYTDLVQVNEHTPMRWEAKTTDGKDVWIHYRGGRLRVYVDNEEYFSESIGGFYDGEIEWSEVERVANLEPA